MPDFIGIHSVLYGWLMSRLYAISFDVCSALGQSPKLAWYNLMEDFVLLVSNTDSAGVLHTIKDASCFVLELMAGQPSGPEAYVGQRTTKHIQTPQVACKCLQPQTTAG